MTKHSSIASTLFSLLAIMVFNNAQAEERERIGYAYDKQTGSFLYSETHREEMKNGRLVKNTVAYRDNNGNVFAEKHIDFHKSLEMPDFHLVNKENGHVEGARGSDDRLTVHFRQLSDATVQEASVEMPPNGIIDAGFDRFIEKNWTSLVNGEVLEREFLIPSQLEFYTFKIEKAQVERAGERVFQLGIKSILLQIFVPPVLVYYDAETRSLLRYEGISNIRNRNGENFDVRIDFPKPDRIQVKSKFERPVSSQLAVR